MQQNRKLPYTGLKNYFIFSSNIHFNRQIVSGHFNGMRNFRESFPPMKFTVIKKSPFSLKLDLKCDTIVA